MVRFNPEKRHKLFTKNTQRIMDTKLTEKQRELLDDIQRDVTIAKRHLATLELGVLNGLTKEQWIDSIYELLYTALNNAKTLCKTTEEKSL